MILLGNKKELSMYIHIPFCKEKCHYCDFLSFKDKDKYFLDYKNALLKEISDFATQSKSKYLIKTIFVGGGTPSILPLGYIGDIMELIYDNFDVCSEAEISIEANVGTLSIEKLKHFKDSKINRLSMGLQSSHNHLLNKIGRIHSYEEFLINFENARNIGFENINIDLMFSLPTQTLQDFKHTLNDICSLEPEHISTYSLILEEETKFFEMYEKNKLSLPSDELDREFYYLALEILQKNKYDIYEISNFSKDNKKCRHNIVYWERKEYIGFGLGASSLIEDSRIVNTNSLVDYINLKNDKIIENLSKEDMYSEFMFLGLRMTRGIFKSDFHREFGVDISTIYGTQIDKFIKNGLIVQNGDCLKLSSKGIDLSNYVFCEFI